MQEQLNQEGSHLDSVENCILGHAHSKAMLLCLHSSGPHTSRCRVADNNHLVNLELDEVPQNLRPCKRAGQALLDDNLTLSAKPDESVNEG